MGSTKEWIGLDAPERGLLPLAWRYVSKKMSPEEEAAWRAAERRGQGDEWVKDRWPRRTAKPQAASNVSGWPDGLYAGSPLFPSHD